MNDTFRKFGWPATRIAETAHWGVMLRPEQPTLGAVVLGCKLPVTAFGEVGPEGMSDLGRAVAAVEAMLASAVRYEKMNYLMLMMVDPDVHFHVLPRYSGAREAAGIDLPDPGWPGPPQLAGGRKLSQDETATLVRFLAERWPG
jgi:diadenosine tetraphosphate (Ap4A) HIT family hydrolase